MGKKYIIELLDDCPSEFKGIIVFGLTPDGQIAAEPIPVEDLTPYTEPDDLEEVKKEAYQQGYEQGYKDGYNEPGKGKIQVGDEVKCIRAGWTAIVTKIKEDGYLTLMGNDGAIANGYDEKDFIKTGRHFPEIAEVLQKMKETDNG